MRLSTSLPLATYLLVANLIFPAWAETVTETVAQVEAKLGGRVGIVLQQQGAAPAAEHRPDERFPLASTFKALVCGAVLAKVDAGEEDLSRTILYGPEALVTYSPVTEKHAGRGMTVGDLCDATITLSDNTAGNLLLDSIGGPEGLTDFLRRTGDAVTRLDRWEPELNQALPGDQRDTTSPRAMLATMERLLFSDLLTPASRAQLEKWMIADQVADELIRASLPEGWTIGDKTGAGERGSRSIVAVIRPPYGDPWLAAIYLTGNEADLKTRNDAIAKIGAAMVETIKAQ
ncbi:class A beta-lactamase [Pseudaminobacter soli (ex Li et al. 2025)]|uniref:class A beta-lactamase n=1 Tax=Pseudaminobacter soli (ex Li et al. 2025) TaxID=1295366 RepID=UPI0024768A84|nr:class A beta-lactamase [Mesorhizobium soli]